MKDQYRTIADASFGEFRDRGSKFLAYAFHASSEEECQERLQEVKKEQPKARHHCYAYRLGMDQHNFRANDDGEPSGTAGRPILGQIDSFDLTNVIVIVVRYFGGTLLGTSGLINAYRNSAAAALEAAQIEEKTVRQLFVLKFSYARMSDVMNAVKKMKLEIIRQEFTDAGRLEVAIRQSKVAEQLLRLKALVHKVSLEEAATLGELEDLEIIPQDLI